jgi:uncharacterized membrane protein HdeD (DUF308 family)
LDQGRWRFTGAADGPVAASARGNPHLVTDTSPFAIFGTRARSLSFSMGRTKGKKMPDAHDRESPAGTGWVWTFVAGVVLVLAGLAAIFHPLATGLATGLLLAWSLIAGGAFALIAGLVDLRAHGGWLYAILGLLAVLAGFVVMFNPFAGALSLVWAIGAWLVVGGILELLGGLGVSHGRTWLILFGLVDILIGVLLMFMDPFSALFFLAVAVGISFVLRGVGLAAFGLALRGPSR